MTRLKEIDIIISSLERKLGLSYNDSEVLKIERKIRILEREERKLLAIK